MNADDREPAPVLLLGDPRLRESSAPVESLAEGGFLRDKARLHATLAAFRPSTVSWTELVSLQTIHRQTAMASGL